MINYETGIAKIIKKIILESVDGEITDNDIKIDHPQNEEFGDYSTNIAMVLAKKEGRNPRELAEDIKNKIINNSSENGFIDKVEVAGTGFINLYLNLNYLKKIAEDINYDEIWRDRLAEYGKEKKVIIDYSAPNIAKPFGIGHLRSTNIGQAIYNVYKTLGWMTIGDNHIGDWGTQFGKLIVAIEKYLIHDSRFMIYKDKIQSIDEMTVDDLELLYVAFHKAAETDEKLLEEARETFVKLEKGDPKTREMWQKCIDLSWKEFNKIYEILGVKIDFTHGESFYEDKMAKVVSEMKAKGIIKQSQGAEIIEYPNMPPAMVTKSNETTTYFTRDMATIKYRMDKWKPDLMIYEVGSDHILHFRQVFEAARMMGWEPKEGFEHIAHGMIRWKTGKFSTREGKTIHLKEVLDKAMEQAINIAEASKVSKEMSATEKDEMIKAVAIGAVKFNDLSQDPRKDIIFDWEKIMSLEGDSGPYLQYTYSRCMSVLSKSNISEQKNIEDLGTGLTAEEKSLIKTFYKFEEKIIESAQRYSPAVVAEYLLTVARKYNEFYAKNKIIGDQNEVRRIFLTRTTASVIKKGLGLLGIDTVERM